MISRNFKIDISSGFRHHEQPWMRYPNNRLYRNIQLEAHIQTALSRHVQGLNISVNTTFSTENLDYSNSKDFLKIVYSSSF